MHSPKSFPIAETFTSVQGEGVYTGTLMHFIRLAGCNVGKYIQADEFGGLNTKDIPGHMVKGDDFPLLVRKEHSVCESILGTKFVCDTNYHKCYDATAQELMQRAGLVEHVCITGGEPFLHDLEDLITHAAQRQVHIETSGTKPIDLPQECAWITCSPKAGFLADNIPLIDEFKFVVSSVEDIRRVGALCETLGLADGRVPIYLQPINWISEINTAGIDMVLAQLEHYPLFRLSAQLHKYLGVR